MPANKTKVIQIECYCRRKKQFPKRLTYQEGKLQGSTTQEIECPFCQELLVIELPGTVVPTDIDFKAIKKAD